MVSALFVLTFAQHISPILRLRCVHCHGQDGISSNGLDLRSYRTVRQGGNIGDDVVPGKPDSSTLVRFIEGRRGPEHRMPLHRRPLPPAQIRLIRQWIAEGAYP